MSALVDRIEARMKEKGTNFKRVERECGLGNGTIKRWSTQSPRLDKLVLVSEHLQLSLDYLAFGGSVSETSAGEPRRAACDGVELSQTEADLVAMFRLLDEHDRSTAFDFVALMYEKATGEKGSIYSTYTDAEKGLKSGPTEGDDAQAGTA